MSYQGDPGKCCICGGVKNYARKLRHHKQKYEAIDQAPLCLKCFRFDAIGRYESYLNPGAYIYWDQVLEEALSIISNRKPEETIADDTNHSHCSRCNNPYPYGGPEVCAGCRIIEKAWA